MHLINKALNYKIIQWWNYHITFQSPVSHFLMGLVNFFWNSEYFIPQPRHHRRHHHHQMNFGAHWTLNTCNSQRECVPPASQFKILLLHFYFPTFCPMFELFSHLLTMRNVISFRSNLTLTNSVTTLSCGQEDTVYIRTPRSKFIVHPLFFLFHVVFYLLWLKSYPSSCS